MQIPQMHRHPHTALRMLTTIEELGWDVGLLAQLGTSFVLNGVLLLQVIKAQSIAHVQQAPQHEHEHAMQLDT